MLLIVFHGQPHAAGLFERRHAYMMLLAMLQLRLRGRALILIYAAKLAATPVAAAGVRCVMHGCQRRSFCQACHAMMRRQLKPTMPTYR